MSGTKLMVTTKNHTLGLLRGALLTAALMLGFTVLLKLVEARFVSSLDGEGFPTAITGIDSCIVIFLFFSGAAFCAQWLKSSLANGISRKTEYLSVLLSAVAMGLLYVAMDYMFEGFETLIFGNYDCSFLANWTGRMVLSDSERIWLRILSGFVSGAESLIAGYALGALWYRLNRGGHVFLLCFSGAFLIISPIMADILWNRFPGWRPPVWIVEFLRWVICTPLGSISMQAICLVIAAVVAFLLVRRAPAKAK